MTKTSTHRVNVQIGDCDPSGLVFFPNFSRWMDEASQMFFTTYALPLHEMLKSHGILGTHVLAIHTRFMKSASYGETIEVHTSIEEWQAQSFTNRHLVKRGENVLCEGTEVRAFVVRDTSLPQGTRAITIPEDIKALCL